MSDGKLHSAPENRPAPNGSMEPGSRPGTLSERVRSLRLPDRPARGLATLRWLPWSLAVVFFGTTVLFAFRSVGATPGGSGGPEVKGGGKGTYPSATAVKGDNKVALQSKGYIIPISLIQVSPISGGKVKKLYITEGDKVEKDKLLAEIEDTEYDADHKRTAAYEEAATHRWYELFKYRDDEVRQARAELDDARVQRDQLLAEYKRSVALKNANALAQKEFEQAESSYKSMEYRVERLKLALSLLEKGPRDNRIAAAKAEVDQAKADVIKAKYRLDNCKVYAPIAGIILSKKAEEGNQVNPAAFSNGLSASVCEMADLTNMEVDLAIAERDISKVYVGQECDIKAEAYPDRKPWKGTVSRIMPAADRGKAAIPVRVKIEIAREEEGKYLRPEMGAIVTFKNQ